MLNDSTPDLFRYGHHEWWICYIIRSPKLPPPSSFGNFHTGIVMLLKQACHLGSKKSLTPELQTLTFSSFQKPFNIPCSLSPINCRDFFQQRISQPLSINGQGFFRPWPELMECGLQVRKIRLNLLC